MEMIEPVEDLPLDVLYGVHRAELLRFLISRTGDPSEAEDLVQDLWLKASRGSAGPTANGRAYLFRMAQNLIVAQTRSILEAGPDGVAEAVRREQGETADALA